MIAGPDFDTYLERFKLTDEQRRAGLQRVAELRAIHTRSRAAR